MISPLRTCAAFVALVCFSRPALAEQADACVGRVGELGGGHVVVIPREPTGGRGVALHACGIVDAPPAEVWPVIRDCGRWDQFMPGVTTSKEQKRTGNTAICEVIVDLPFPLPNLRSLTSIVEIARPDGGFSRRSMFLEGTYRHNNGYWILLPRDDGSKTLLVYDIDFDPEIAVPDFLLRTVQSGRAPEIFKSIRERVKTCVASAMACGGGQGE